ncbi:hypothetical protein JW868_01105 [Candidatus Woesearchaeota archaeon]|nr:hypothetical protein [Candidatus Woesearchaeota archaeon]
MMKNLLFLFLLLVPVASAIDCSKTMHADLCEQVISSDAASDEKEWLVTELIQDRRNSPNHEFVYDWNTKVDTFLPPEGITKYSSGFIKDSWLKLLSVMPSFLENDTLYINDTGELLSAYNHRIEIPPDYRSPGYPRTKDGDCATYYHLVAHTAVFDAFNNHAYLGSDNFVNYTASCDAEFSGRYDILLRTDIDHWKWNKYCCAKNKKGKCTKYCYTCKFSYTQNKVDNVTVTDKIETKHYKQNMTASFILLDQYENTSKGKLKASNFSSLHLDFAESNFTEYNYVYTLNRSIPPHNILTVKAEKLNRKSARNLNFIGNETYTLTLKNTSNCTITLQDHFSTKNLPCNLTAPEPDAVIETDKTSYDDNETIRVTIMPDKEFNITYAGRNYTASGSINLKAEYPHNRISIFQKGKEISKVIQVKDKQPWNVLLSVTMFGSLNYILVGIVRKTWGGLL